MSQFVDLPVDEIVMDTITQGRVSMDIEIVEAYAEAMLNGDTFPAIVVFEKEGNPDSILADGWYRTMAAKEAGIKSLMAEVMEGDLDDAILYAAGANARHGIRRTDEDKRNSVLMLLERDKWIDLSTRQIAEAAKVGHALVARIKAEVSPETPDSDKGGTVVGRDGKSYPAKVKKKAKKKPEPVERRVLDILSEMAELYTELPRDPQEAITELLKGDEWIGAGRANHIAWWFKQYATLVTEYEKEGEDIVIDVPDPA